MEVQLCPNFDDANTGSEMPRPPRLEDPAHCFRLCGDRVPAAHVERTKIDRGGVPIRLSPIAELNRRDFGTEWPQYVFVRYEVAAPNKQGPKMTQAAQDAIASVFRCVADLLDLPDDAGIVAAVIEEERLITALTGQERELAIALTRALTARLVLLEPQSRKTTKLVSPRKRTKGFSGTSPGTK